MRQNIWRQSISGHGLQPVSKQIPKPTIVNKEGFPAYHRSIEEQVLQVLMTGSVANLFYASAKENIKQMTEVLIKCDNEFLRNAIVYARNEGFTRTIPIAGTVVLTKKNLDYFKEIANEVCKNPHDWKQFIDICRSKEIRNGVGRALKRKINEAIKNMSTYHAIKYPTDVLDMINIARPNVNVNLSVINYIKKNEIGEDKILEGLWKLKNEKDSKKIAEIIKEVRLPYEVVTGTVKPDKEIWEALLYSAPYFNLLRNLNNFIRNGVFANRSNLDYAIKVLTNEEKIKKSKLFPFRYYVAYNNLIDLGYNELKNALLKALEKSIMNVPEINGAVAIAPDVSGSMTSNVTSDNSVLQCIDIVGLFSGILIKKCKTEPVILPFESDINWNIVKNLSGKETIFEMAKQFHASGGTSLSAPVRWLYNNKVKVDKIIAFTDNEEWVGSPFLEEFLSYKDISPECKAYLVTLLPYRDVPVPPEIEDVFFIYGWSDNVLKYLTFDVNKQIEDVRNYKVAK